MQTRIVHDDKGEWLVNIAKFPFVDPEVGSRFEPNVPTKAKVTDWVKAQEAVIKPWVDPAEANAEAEKAAAEKAEADRLAAEKAAAEKAEADRLAAEKAAADASKKSK